MSLVSIHQPNFLPWLGYFEKIAQSDIHVILDHVFPSLTNDYLTRTMLQIGKSLKWFNLPIKKEQRKQNIAHMNIEPLIVNKAIKEKFVGIYGKAAEHYIKKIDLLSIEGSDLVAYNMQVNFNLAELIGYQMPKIYKSSQLDLQESDINGQLIEIVKKLGGDAYLSGMGSKSYLDLERFKEEDLEVTLVDFQEKVSRKWDKPACSAFQYILELSL
jgi:hypothetical protein